MKGIHWFYNDALSLDELFIICKNIFGAEINDYYKDKKKIKILYFGKIEYVIYLPDSNEFAFNAVDKNSKHHNPGIDFIKSLCKRVILPSNSNN